MRSLSTTHALASLRGDQIPSGSPPGQPGEVSATSSERWWENFAVCIFLAGIIWFVFGQTLGHEFVDYDDGEYVYQNGRVAGGLTPQGIAWAFTHFACNFYHPLTMLSLMLDYQLHGLRAGGYHLTSVLLHAASAALLFLVLRRMTGALWRSAFVAAVFAIHPLRVESVAWVAERKDVLCGLFFMVTLAAYVHYARRPFSTGNYLALFVAFVFGLLAKPAIVTLPFLLILLDYWPLRRFANTSVQRLLLEKLPLLLLSTVASVTGFFAQGEAVASVAHYSVPVRLANGAVSYATYLFQLIFPVGLVPHYPHLEGSLPLWQIVLSGIVLAGISTLALLSWRRRPYVTVGWFWYVGMLVPMIGLVQVGNFAHADRFTYLPQIGLCVAGTWALADWARQRRNRRVALGCGAGVVLCVLLVAAYRQASYWHDGESLWLHTISCTSRNAVAHSNLAITYLRKGRADDAIAQCRKALDIQPQYAEAHCNLANALLRKGQIEEAIVQCQRALQIRPRYAEAYRNLGSALLQKGLLDEAIIQFRKSIALNPDDADAYCCLGAAARQNGQLDEAMQQYRKALDIQPNHAMANNNLGNALIQSGQFNEAIIHYHKALQNKPEYADAHYNLGKALMQTVRLDEAIYHFRKALEIAPSFAAAHAGLGSALAQRGMEEKAIHHLEMALRIAPENLPAQYSLSWILATSSNAVLRDGSKAIELAQHADQQTSGKDPFILCTLAAAYAEAGRFPEAEKTVSLALELAKTQSDTDLAKQLQAQLKLYQSNLPFHQAFKPETPPLPAPKPPIE